MKQKKVFIISQTKEIIDGSTLKIITLSHPKTKKNTQFGVLNKQIYEISETNTNKGSFFCDNQVLESGSLYILTKFDPLFLLISILEENRKKSEKDLFNTMEQILSNFQELKLIHFDSQWICDTKELDDDLFFRLNDEKVLEWLSKKVEILSDFISKKFYSKLSGSTLRFNSKEEYKPTKEEIHESSLNFLCEYLSPYFGLKICEKFEIPFVDHSLVVLNKRDDSYGLDANSIKNFKKKRKVEEIEPAATASQPQKKMKSGPKFVEDKNSKKITSFFKKK
jgi:ribonuclease H2 subunit B